MQLWVQRSTVAQKFDADIAVLIVKALDEVLGEQLHDGTHLFQRALPVLGGEGVDGQHVKAKADAGGHGLAQRVDAGDVPTGTVQATGLRPAAVPVHDDRDVSGCEFRFAHISHKYREFNPK